MSNYQLYEFVVKALIKKDSTFLILKKSTSDQTNDLSGWETPGGHIEKDEDIYSCLEREIKEETSIKIKSAFLYNAFVNYRENENPVIGLNYVAEYKEGGVVLDGQEHSNYRWATIEEIKNLNESIGLQKEITKFEEFQKIKGKNIN